MVLLSAIFLVSTAFAAASAAAENAALRPTGRWIVEYADNMCVLQREYGTPNKPVTLSFRPSPVSDYVTLYVFDARTGQAGQQVSALIGFGPGQEPVKTSMDSFDPRGKPFRFNSAGFRRHALARALTSGRIEIKARRRIDLAFEVPALENALKILDDCVADLVDGWGLSRTAQNAIAKQAEPARPVFHSNDYPSSAMRKNTSGLNSARIWVDENGRASECTLVEASGDRSLDEALCRGLLRGRFHPAKNKAGNPMRSLYFTRVRWFIPD